MKEINFLKDSNRQKIVCFFIITATVLVTTLAISYSYFYTSKKLEKEISQVKKSLTLLTKNKKLTPDIKISRKKNELSKFLAFMEIVNRALGTAWLDSATFDNKGIHLSANFMQLSDAISFAKSISNQSKNYQIKKIKSAKNQHVSLYFKKKSSR